MKVVENKDDDEVLKSTAYMLGDYEIDIQRIDFYVLSTHAPLQQDIKVEVYYMVGVELNPFLKTALNVFVCIKLFLYLI